MAFADETPEYRNASAALRSLSDNMCNRVYDIVRDLSKDEQRRLVTAWFGDDFYEGYLEWFEEGEE